MANRQPVVVPIPVPAVIRQTSSPLPRGYHGYSGVPAILITVQLLYWCVFYSDLCVQYRRM